MKRFLKIVMIILLLSIIAGGILYYTFQKQNSQEPETPTITYRKDTMITNIRLGVSNFDNINPLVTNNRDILNMSQLIFEPLLTITEDYHIENCLAKEYSKINATSYAIKLNENVKWHNGNDFTAEDVKYTIETLQKNNSIYTENVKEIEAVEIVDKYTLRINLSKEIPFFEYHLIFPIISKAQYENKSLKDEKEIPVGTGRYKISELEEEKIELTKNENWQNINNQDANIRTVIITKYETMGEVYNAFKLGKIDLFQSSNENLEEHIGSLGYQKKEYKGREYDYLAFNCQNKVLQYPEVRKAIEEAINQKEILTTVFENNGYAAYFPLDYGNYIVGDFNNSNKKTAKEILEDAGWSYEYGTWRKRIEGAEHTLKFTMIVSKNNEQRVKMAQTIQKMLENIGIKIAIQEVSDSSYQSYLKNHNYEMILTGIYNSYSPDLTTFFGEENLANYQNTEMQKLLNDVKNITNEELLKEKYQKILEIYQEDMPYIGLYRNKNRVIYNNHLMGDVRPNNYSIFYQFQDWYREQS